MSLFACLRLLVLKDRSSDFEVLSCKHLYALVGTVALLRYVSESRLHHNLGVAVAPQVGRVCHCTHVRAVTSYVRKVGVLSLEYRYN